MNLKKLYVLGVRTGSMARCVRRRSGVEWLIAGVTILCRMVGIINVDGQRYDGSVRRFWMNDRLGREMGVRISLLRLVGWWSNKRGTYLVLTRSSGARRSPVATDAATATASDAQGYTESATSVVAPNPPITPASGTFKSADNMPLDQLSTVLSRNA